MEGEEETRGSCVTVGFGRDRRSQRTLSLFSGRPPATTGCLEHGPIIQHHGMRSRLLEIEKFVKSPDFRCLPMGVTRKSELFSPEAELPRSARKFSPFWLAFLLISTILSTVFTYRTGGSSSTHEHSKDPGHMVAQSPPAGSPEVLGCLRARSCRNVSRLSQDATKLSWQRGKAA